MSAAGSGRTRGHGPPSDEIGGGTFALALACRDEELRSASVFYGQNPRLLSALRRACPIVGSYPETDRLTRGAGLRLRDELAAAGVPHDVKLYEGARYSLFNEDGRAYDPAAAGDSWQRTLEFFAAHIGA